MSKSSKAAKAAIAKPRAQAAAVATATKSAKKAPPPAAVKKANGMKSPAAPSAPKPKGAASLAAAVEKAVDKVNKQQADNIAAVADEASQQAAAGIVTPLGTISLAAMTAPTTSEPPQADTPAEAQEQPAAPPPITLQSDSGWGSGVTFKDAAWETDTAFQHVAAVTRAIRRISAEIGIKVMSTLVPDLNLCNLGIDRYIGLTVRKDGKTCYRWAATGNGPGFDISTQAGAEAAARAALDVAGQEAAFSKPVSGAAPVDVGEIVARKLAEPESATTQPVASGNTLVLCAPVTPQFDLFAEVDVGNGDIFRLEAFNDAYHVRKAVTQGDPTGADFKVTAWQLLAKGLTRPSDGLRVMATEIDRLDGNIIVPEPTEIAAQLIEVAGALRKYDENAIAQRCRWMAARLRGQEPKDEAPPDASTPPVKGEGEAKPAAQPARIATPTKTMKPLATKKPPRLIAAAKKAAGKGKRA